MTGTTYHGPTCSHPHNLPYNDECAVWWLRGTPGWRLAHTNLETAQEHGTGSTP
jgi:hypothetical protein